jgi:hypothetical protein
MKEFNKETRKANLLQALTLEFSSDRLFYSSTSNSKHKSQLSPTSDTIYVELSFFLSIYNLLVYVMRQLINKEMNLELNWVHLFPFQMDSSFATFL